MYDMIHNKLFTILERQPPWLNMLQSLIATGLLGVLDYYSGDYSFVLFYLIPIFATSWFVGKKRGILICIICAITNSVANSGNITTLVSTPSNLYWDSILEFIYLLLLSLMFSTLKERLDREKLMARLDPLTGILNRRSFYELGEFELSRAQRYARPFTLAYIDLDNFKQVNDSMGHKEGDQLLCTVVKTMRDSSRNTDIIARFGGDEFVLILPETGPESGRSALAKLKDQLDMAMEKGDWPVTFSIGAVTYGTPPTTVDEMISIADSFMYQVKSSSKNAIYHKFIE